MHAQKFVRVWPVSRVQQQRTLTVHRFPNLPHTNIHIVQRASVMAGAVALEIALQLSAGDAFGCSTALLGDHLVIGACGDSGAGAVYSIRVRSLTAPPPFEVLEVVRAADGGSAGAEFGASVFVTETHLFVGAPSHATDPLLPTQRHGAAFLWPLSLDAATGARRVGNPRRILSNSPRNGAHFGASVAIAGNRMIIGESGTGIYPAGVPTPEDNGYVYVFHLVSGALLKKLSPVNPTSGELAIGCYGFGASLALSTRRGQLAVGSPKARARVVRAALTLTISPSPYHPVTLSPSAYHVPPPAPPPLSVGACAMRSRRALGCGLDL
jgi:hypothetical protein